jgi:replicative DNA helicase
MTTIEQTRNGAPGRVPPHNLEAEESLLGAMLLSRDAIAAAGEVGISGHDFYKPAHGHIFDAVVGIYQRGEPVDPVTVAESLRRSDLLDAIGGTAVLVTLRPRRPPGTPASSRSMPCSVGSSTWPRKSPRAPSPCPTT